MDTLGCQHGKGKWTCSKIVLCVCPGLPSKGPSFTWYNPNNLELTPLAISVEQPGDSAWEAPQS